MSDSKEETMSDETTSKVTARVKTTHSITATIPMAGSGEGDDYAISVQMSEPDYVWLLCGPDDEGVKVEWAAFEELYLKMKELRDRTFVGMPTAAPLAEETKT